MLRKVVSALLVFVMLSSAVMPVMAAKALTVEQKTWWKHWLYSARLPMD